MVHGDVARRNFGLVAGDSARASIWLPPPPGTEDDDEEAAKVLRDDKNPEQKDVPLIDVDDDFFGLPCRIVVVVGELGMEQGVLGTSVSELVASLSSLALDSEPVDAFADRDTTTRAVGTVSVRRFEFPLIVTGVSFVIEESSGMIDGASRCSCRVRGATDRKALLADDDDEADTKLTATADV